jgi:aminoglycoside phosphotransferase (APT) family kinase protein
VRTSESDNAGTAQVRAQYRFDQERLTDWMADNVAGFSGPLTVEQFKGGQSNPTYKLSTPARSYVLRRKPPGELSLGVAYYIQRKLIIGRLSM